VIENEYACFIVLLLTMKICTIQYFNQF